MHSILEGESPGGRRSQFLQISPLFGQISVDKLVKPCYNYYLTTQRSLLCIAIKFGFG